MQRGRHAWYLVSHNGMKSPDGAALRKLGHSTPARRPVQGTGTAGHATCRGGARCRPSKARGRHRPTTWHCIAMHRSATLTYFSPARSAELSRAACYVCCPSRARARARLCVYAACCGLLWTCTLCLIDEEACMRSVPRGRTIAQECAEQRRHEPRRRYAACPHAVRDHTRQHLCREHLCPEVAAVQCRHTHNAQRMQSESVAANTSWSQSACRHNCGLAVCD